MLADNVLMRFMEDQVDLESTFHPNPAFHPEKSNKEHNMNSDFNEINFVHRRRNVIRRSFLPSLVSLCNKTIEEPLIIYLIIVRIVLAHNVTYPSVIVSARLLVYYMFSKSLLELNKIRSCAFA